jgi:hypothetical protein
MSSKQDDLAVIEIEKPRLHRGHPHCPRCDTRLRYDGAEFLCLACGYGYGPDERELAETGRRSVARLPPGLALGVIAIAVTAVAALALYVRGCSEQRFHGRC